MDEERTRRFRHATSGKPRLSIEKVGRSTSVSAILVGCPAEASSSCNKTKNTSSGTPSINNKQPSLFSGDVTAMSNNNHHHYFTMLLPVTFSDEEIKLLRDSFLPFIKDAKDVGLDMMKKLIANMPETLLIFRSSPNRVVRLGDEWELMNQGVTFMHAIERCLLRLDKVDYLYAYVRRLMSNHKQYNVSVEQMLTAYGIFMQIILDRLAITHNHYYVAENSNNKNSSSSSSSTNNNNNNNEQVIKTTSTNDEDGDMLMPLTPKEDEKAAGSVFTVNNANNNNSKQICLICSAWIKFHGLLSILFSTFKNVEPEPANSNNVS